MNDIPYEQQLASFCVSSLLSKKEREQKAENKNKKSAPKEGQGAGVKNKKA